MASTATDETRLGALSRLDFRGYDSVLICVYDGNGRMKPSSSLPQTLRATIDGSETRDFSCYRLGSVFQ